MNNPLFDPVSTEEMVKSCEAAAREAQAALTKAQTVLDQAQEELSQAQRQHAMAQALAGIVRDADTRTGALITAYTKAQQTKLLEAFGSDPATWSSTDPSTIQPEPLWQWLAGKTIVDADTLTKMFAGFKSQTSTALPEELRGENQLHNFAQLLVNKMHVDDGWPQLVVVDDGGYTVKNISIRFAKPTLR